MKIKFSGKFPNLPYARSECSGNTVRMGLGGLTMRLNTEFCCTGPYGFSLPFRIQNKCNSLAMYTM